MTSSRYRSFMSMVGSMASSSVSMSVLPVRF
jgi:hypothetical protein